MDNAIVILSKYAVRSFLVLITNIDEVIQFTVYRKNEKSELPLLDCLIQRNTDGTLDTAM